MPPALSTSSISVLRPDDLLSLDLQLINLKTEPVGGLGQCLTKVDVNQPAYLVAHLPPQNVAEEAFAEGQIGAPPPIPPPVPTIMAGPSRLVFLIPDTALPLSVTLESLLDWSQFPLCVSPAAAAPLDRPAVVAPGIPQSETETAIEFPFRLIISPDQSAGWTHALKPVTHGIRTELWHTRLGQRREILDEGGVLSAYILESAAANIMVLASTDRLAGASPPLLSLSRQDREQLVELTTGWTQPPQAPRPVKAKRFMLSALGAWAHLEGNWWPTSRIEAWTHRATQGRDHYVRIVEAGFVLPFGHRASLVTVTERRPAGGIAYLWQRRFVVVREPVKRYDGASYQYAGREMPFESIEIKTLVTPPISVPGGDTTISFPIVIDAGGSATDVQFQILGRDRSGHELTWTMPLTWVPQALGSDPLRATQLAGTYHSQAAHHARRQGRLNGQPVTFAESSTAAGNLDAAGETTLTTLSFSWGLQSPANTHLPDAPKFLPRMEVADVEIPALKQLLSGTKPSVFIRLSQAYLDHGFPAGGGGANAGEVFAELVNSMPETKMPPERTGGLARPDMRFDGLSRLLGPVANQAQVVSGGFDPAQIFPTEATLLGGIQLGEIIASVPLNPGEIRATMNQVEQDPTIPLASLGPMQAPFIVSRPRFAAGTSAANGPLPEPEAVETYMLWNPALLGSHAILKPRGAPEDMQLALRTHMVQQLATNQSSMRVEGRLSNFAIDFADVMRVSFDALTFVAEPDRKPDVSAEGVDVSFGGALAFVNELRKIMPGDGWSDPPELAVTPQGITSHYSLGIPSVGVGIFSLQNIALSAQLSIPFVSQPAGVRFAVSERHSPFLVTLGIFGGGGFFALSLSTSGIEQIEASIEFGANISLNLGVASGGVYVMAGIYFNMVGSDVKLTGYLRCGGALQVLGLITISVEFYMQLTYDLSADKVTGRASLTVCVEVLFFSKSVSLTVERKFGGSSGDPAFDDMVDEPAWIEYCDAFAA